MTLDLDELTMGWDCPAGELRARTVTGRDGQELLQLRVDLGVMQMFPDGRPDGERYRGLPTARDYIEHEMRVGGEDISPDDWEELERELVQLNYRRMAYSAVSEDALRANEDGDARRFIMSALRDIERCLGVVRLLANHAPLKHEHASIRPTLVFDQARLSAQLKIIEGYYEDAVEQADLGAGSLETLLTQLGYDEDACEDDPGLRYLRGLGEQLRREYGIARTLRERLDEAIENEDFELAAELRDELRRREVERKD